MPKLIKLDADEKSRLGNEIVDQWTQDCEDKDVWLHDLAKWLHAYQGRMEQKDIPFEGASNLQVPVTATVVETIHPRMMAALTRPKPIVGFRPQEPTDYDRARKRETFLDWAMREEINIFPTLDRGVLNTLINGIQFVRTVWDLRIRKVRDKHEFPIDTPLEQVLQEVMGEEAGFIEAVQRVAGGKVEAVIKGRKVEVEVEENTRFLVVYTDREEVVYDAPRCTLRPAEDICVNSDAEYNLQEADHIYDRFWMTLQQIKREVKTGIFAATSEELDKIETLVSPDKEASDNTSDVKYMKETIAGVQSLHRQGEPGKVELIDAYFKYDVDDDGYDEEVIATVVKDAPSIMLRLVRLEEVFRHGMRPYVMFYFNPVAESIWAIGVPQILEGIQLEFNVIHNQRTDAGMLANTPFGVYVPAAGFNPEKMPIEAGFMYPVDDVNAVKWYSPTVQPAWSFQEEQGLWALTERRTKVNDLSMGRIGDSQGAARTASGAQILASQQATGFDIYIRRFQESFKQLCQQVLALYQQYMPPGKEVRITGMQGEQDYIVSRADITGAMDMEFTGNSLSTDRQIERETLTFLAQSVLSPGSISMLLQLGLTDPPGVAEWYRKLLQAFDITGLERIIKIPAHLPLLTPEEVVTKILQGEDVKPQQGENHEAIVQLLQQQLQGPDAMGLPAESKINAQKQIMARAQQAQQEAMQAMMMQQQQQQMMQQQIAMFGGMNAPNFGGAPQNPTPRPAQLPY